MSAECCNLVAHFVHNDNIICFESAMLQWAQPWLEAHAIPSCFLQTNLSCTSLDCCAHQWQDIDQGSKAVFQEHVNHSDTNGCFYLCRSKLTFDLSVFDSWCRAQRCWGNIWWIYCCCAAFRICLLLVQFHWQRWGHCWMRENEVKE